MTIEKELDYLIGCNSNESEVDESEVLLNQSDIDHIMLQHGSFSGTGV